MKNSIKEDTIVALATPFGIGAIAVIRLSGNESIAIVDSVFEFKSKIKTLKEAKSHTLHVGFLVDDKRVVDEVVVSIFKNPKSYTGEDLVEISCHGSVYIQKKIVELMIKNGARAAEPGEFTLRAFLNGKMDLSQTEAVADIIHSQSEAAKNIAINQLRGGFSNDLKLLKEKLIHFASLVELELDFSEEDLEFVDRKDLLELLHHADVHILELISSFKYGNVIKNGISTAIIGKPNSGKSTLLNALINEERAIVTEIPGTTRDTLEESLYINGIQFRFIDTAGIRDTNDKIEQMGVERSLEKLKTSHIFIYLFDINSTKLEDLQKEILIFPKDIPHILVANKVDAAEQNRLDKFQNFKEEILFLSAKEKQHLDLLKEKLFEKLELNKIDTNAVIVSNTRHLDALQKVQQSLKEVEKGIGNAISGDLLAIDIRQSLYCLGSITGEITSDDVLGNVFANFCVGK